MKRALFAMLIVACEATPRTQVMVIIDADAELRAQLAEVGVAVEGGASRTTLEAVSEETISVRHWPLQLPIVPRDGDDTRFFRVEATGYDSAGAPVVVARAISGFVGQETRALVIRLERSCAGRFDCARDETCAQGACRDAFVSPDELPVLGSDAGTIATSDAGPDTGMDGGPPPRDGGPDAGMIDAGMLDAGMLDAGMLDAGMLDGGYDAGFDAGPPPCLAPNVMCGAECVDLASDPNHCGACGYAVVGARTCASGIPTPPWLSIDAASAPLAPSSRIVWTGRELLYVSDPATGTGGAVHAFDPSAGTWSSVTTPLGGIAMSPPLYLVGLPDRNAALLFQSTGAFLWEHSTGAGAWRPLPTAPSSLSSTVIEGTLTAYTGRYVFLFDGAGTGNGLRFDLTDETWATVPATTHCSFNAWTRALGHVTTTYVNGSVVLLTSADSRTTNPPSLCTNATQNAAVLDPDMLTWTNQTVNRNSALLTGSTGNASLLTIGATVYLAGGPRFGYCSSSGVLERDAPVLWAPSIATTLAVTYPGMPASSAFTAFTGRALLSWGGTAMPATCSSSPVQIANSLGVGIFDGAALTWRAGPPNSLPFRAIESSNNAQSLWTGRELAVINGILYAGGTLTRPRGGARYQPPVGCVCPRNASTPPSVADGCSGVAMPSPPYDVCVP